MYDPLAADQGRFPISRGAARRPSRNGVYKPREAVASYPLRGHDGVAGVSAGRRTERRLRFLSAYPLAMAYIAVTSVAAIVVELVR